MVKNFNFDKIFCMLDVDLHLLQYLLNYVFIVNIFSLTFLELRPLAPPAVYMKGTEQGTELNDSFKKGTKKESSLYFNKGMVP